MPKFLADALLDPTTQAPIQIITMLRSLSDLDPALTDAAGWAAFSALPIAPALPVQADLEPVLPEPHHH